MKKLLLILLLSNIIFSQVKKYDFDIVRGDKTNLSAIVQGDYSTYKLIFVVKADKELTSDRLIEKKNTLAGGTGITATYNGKVTSFVISIDKEDTQDFTNLVYYYDLTATSISDTSNIKTILTGTLNLTFDVQTPYDGTDLPNNATRYLPILPDSFHAGEFIKSDGTNFTGDSLNDKQDVIPNIQDTSKYVEQTDIPNIHLTDFDTSGVSSSLKVLSASKLTTARTIGGNSFDGSANIPLSNITPGSDFTLTQNGIQPFTSVASGAVANTIYIKDGNVGIGTISPSEELHISKSQNANTNILIENANTGSAAWARLETKNDAGKIGGFGIAGSGTTVANTTFIYGNGSLRFLSNNAVASGGTDPITFYVGGYNQEIMRITSTGNVGIGTKSPDSTATVNGSGHFTTNVLVDGKFKASDYDFSACPTDSTAVEPGHIWIDGATGIPHRKW